MNNENLKAFTVRDMQKESYRIADEHGWHDKPRTVGDKIALMHSELSEALEAFREKNFSDWEVTDVFGKVKPEGIGSELADVVIRIGDFCEEHTIDLSSQIERKLVYNETRPYRHGGKQL